jgi:acyl-CoA thioesterase-1
MIAMKCSVLFRSLLFCVCLAPTLAAAQSTILVFGDSLSAAYGLPREAGWVALLQRELQNRQPPRTVVNASISGETTSGGRARIAAALERHKPDIVILELGANDGLRGTSLVSMEANLAEIIRQSQAARAKVLLIGMRLPPNYGADYTKKFHALYEKLAQQYHVALVPFLLDGIAPEQFQADNLHPSAAAQPRMLRNVMGELEKILTP